MMESKLNMFKLLPNIFLVMLLLLLAGCGGGETTGKAPLNMNKGVVLSVSLKQGLLDTHDRVLAVEVEFKLPEAASPAMGAGAELLPGETGLLALNQNGNIQYGTFDSSTRTVKFTILANYWETGDLGTGDIARLTYTTNSGAELSSQEIQQIADTIILKVSGPKPDPDSEPINLSNEIVPSVRVLTYLK